MIRQIFIYILLTLPWYSVIAQNQHYLHIAHTRTNANPSMDMVAESIDYSIYDMLWLGGDMALSTSIDEPTMRHVDSIYDVGNENTLWALGNHDYADLDRIQAYTGRPPYYVYDKNNITFLVLDSQDSLSSITGQQKELFRSVTDTITESSHLVLLHHKLIWMYGNAYLQSQIPYISNGSFGDCFSCINPNNFYTEIYPELLKVKERGIEVICIAGDIGFRRSEFEYLTLEGIQFLASGIEAGKENNKALLLTHDLNDQTLSWEYKLLSQLSEPPDTSAPVLHTVSIAPDSVTRGDTIRITIDAEDPDSGLDQIRVDMINPAGEPLHAISNSIGEWTTRGDHIYTFDWIIPDSAVSGTWNLSALHITDSAGNELYLDNQDSVLATFTVFVPVGLTGSRHPQVHLFPNPSSGIIHFSGDPDVILLVVMDHTGRIVETEHTPGTNSVDLTGKPGGLYLLRLYAKGGGIIVKKVLIY